VELWNKCEVERGRGGSSVFKSWSLNFEANLSLKISEGYLGPKPFCRVRKNNDASSVDDLCRLHNFHDPSSSIMICNPRFLPFPQVYTLRELLYAMMLPSGNDASICIAEVSAMNPKLPTTPQPSSRRLALP
jgi:hypothetical protein